MCILIISNYYGRSGNNLLQLINNTYNCILNNYKDLLCPKHKLFTKINKIDNNNSCKCNNIINNNSELLFKTPLSITTIKKIFHNYYVYNLNNVDNNDNIYDIAIHIRSGDIFDNIGRSHRLYLQPPYYFYKKIIDENKKSKIIIVYENKKNPVINKLIQYCKYNTNIFFQSTNIKDDINTLSKCKTLVFSNGTFCLIPYVISKTIKEVIISDYMENNIWFIFDKDITKIINLPNYIKQNQWSNKIQQQKYMLNYENK